MFAIVKCRGSTVNIEEPLTGNLHHKENPGKGPSKQEKHLIVCYGSHTQVLNKHSKCIKLNFNSLSKFHFIC